MAHTLGRVGSLSAAGSAVGGIVNMSSDLANGDVDATDFDSAGFKERVYGDTERTISVTVRRDEADAGQDALRAAAVGKTTVAMIFRPTVASGSDQFSFTGYVTSYGVSNDQEALVEETFEIVSSGTITSDTQ